MVKWKKTIIATVLFLFLGVTNTYATKEIYQKMIRTTIASKIEAQEHRKKLRENKLIFVKKIAFLDDDERIDKYKAMVLYIEKDIEAYDAEIREANSLCCSLLREIKHADDKEEEKENSNERESTQQISSEDRVVEQRSNNSGVAIATLGILSAVGVYFLRSQGYNTNWIVDTIRRYTQSLSISTNRAFNSTGRYTSPLGINTNWIVDSTRRYTPSLLFNDNNNDEENINRRLESTLGSVPTSPIFMRFSGSVE
ncbi:MAG: hypothetical protein AAF443_08560 [Chlamydiota bacterium]